MSDHHERKESVEAWVHKVVTLPVRRFSPTVVAKDTRLPLEEAFQYLLETVDARKLNLLWEVRCPNLECVRTLSVTPSKPIGRETTCPVCGEDVEITSDIVFPIFEVIPNSKTK